MDKVINILLVEDDQLDVMDIQRTLSKLNLVYHLDIAKNGEEALELLQQYSRDNRLPDVTLIDINMPRMNGLELLKAIRENAEWKDLKCFIITTSAEAEDKQLAKSLGVSGYIVKPLKLSNTASLDSFNLMIDLMNLKNQ